MSRCQDVLPNYKIFQHKMGVMMCDGHHNKRIDLFSVGFQEIWLSAIILLRQAERISIISMAMPLFSSIRSLSSTCLTEIKNPFSPM